MLFSTKGHGDLDHDLYPQCHLLVRTNIPPDGPSPKLCQDQAFSTKGPGDLDLCPQDHLLVRTLSLLSLRVITIGIAEL